MSQEDCRLSMKDIQQVRSMKPSLRKPGQKLFKRKSTTFNNESYFIFHYTKNQNKRQLFECRLQFWSARIESKEFFIYFLNKGCNPFLIQYQGFNCLHIAANKGKYEILKFILENNYQYKEREEFKQKHPYLTEEELSKTQKSKYIFDKNIAINMMTDLNPSNALHLAIEINDYECMQILVENGVSVDVLNHRCLKPFELTFNNKMVEYYEKKFLNKHFQSFNSMGYMYVLQTKGQLDINQDTVQSLDFVIVYYQKEFFQKQFQDYFIFIPFIFISLK